MEKEVIDLLKYNIIIKGTNSIQEYKQSIIKAWISKVFVEKSITLEFIEDYAILTDIEGKQMKIKYLDSKNLLIEYL